MLENIRLAFRGIASHKMRSFLTMLGIIIGIASIMSIVSTIKGTNDALRDKLVGSGNNTVKVSLSSGGQELSIYDASSVPQNVQPIADETRQKIADLKTVKQVTLYNKRFVTDSSVFYGDNSVSQFNMYGVDDVYFDTVGYRLKTGRAFLESDYTLFRKVMILDQVASQKLFPDTDPLGKTVEFMGQPFTVIGVMYEPDDYEPDIQTVEDYYNNQDNSNGLFFIPKADWPIVFNYDEPENVIVKATSTDDMTTAGGAAAKILNQTITSTSDDTPKYQAEDLLGIVKSQQKLTAAANMQLIWIAARLCYRADGGDRPEESHRCKAECHPWTISDRGSCADNDGRPDRCRSRCPAFLPDQPLFRYSGRDLHPVVSRRSSDLHADRGHIRPSSGTESSQNGSDQCAETGMKTLCGNCAG